MARGPLDHPRLRAIEQSLDAGKLEEAQRLLVEFGDVALFRPATSFLATRLLFQRGRLSLPLFIERLRDLLRIVDYFPEAKALLEAAETGQDEQVGGQTAPLVGEASVKRASPQAPSRRSVTTVPNIPRAPLVPAFTPPPDVRPSYAPDHVPPPVPPAHDAMPPTEREGRKRDDAPATSAREAASGRYARRPTVSVDVVRRSPKPETISAPVPREKSRLRSGRPPTDDDDPSLAGIATLLDEGRFDRALELVERAGPESAERRILHARSLLGAGRRGQARLIVERMTAEALEPEARAAAARLLLDLGEPERALQEAERAQQDARHSPIADLTLALTLLRVAWRRDEPSFVARAEELLRAFRGRDSPMPALVQALRACVQAKGGDPERAIGAAQRALALDARSADALIALAVGSARLGRHDEARQAWADLQRVAAHEADAIVPTLARLGLSISPARR